MKKKKRTTFIKLFAGSGLTALIVTAVFGSLFHELMLFNLRQDAGDSLGIMHTQLITKISQNDNKYDDPLPQIKHSMNLYTYCSVWLFDTYERYDVQLVSDLMEDCHAVSIIIDENDNIIASSKEALTAMIKIDDKAEGYICDRDVLNNPQVDELYSVYHELAKNDSITKWVDVVVDSAYVDRENYIFIPHKCHLEIKRKLDMKRADIDTFAEPYETIKSQEIKIDIADENYELITFETDARAVPNISLTGFRGTEEKFYNEHMSDFQIETGFHYMNNDNFITSRETPVWIGGEKYRLYSACIINEKSPLIMSLYIKVVIAFMLACIFIALLWSWCKNTGNKAQYAFEDYQKTLINNLAHDLKTPLTAISGYAENAQQSDELGEISGYLDSICTNVLYMDSIVNHTLELNHLQEIKIKKESVDLIRLAENALEKYSLMLEEKNIRVETDGGCCLMADKNTIETAIENLISNAVKYTPENGNIAITAEKNSFTITNNIAEKIDVKNLTMPFVKSDKSRTEKSGGLGLTIVQNCADINGLKFRISSTENQFIAVIKK